MGRVTRRRAAWAIGLAVAGSLTVGRAGSAGADAGLVRDPYLQRATATSLDVVWRSVAPEPSLVRYGTHPEALDRRVSDPRPALDHRVTLTGLAPGTRYFYALGPDAAATRGRVDAFVTPPARGERAPLLAWIVGDSGTGGARQLAVRDAMLRATADRRPDLFLHVGDMAYRRGSEEEFTTRFFSPYRDVLRRTVVWPVIGNHEARTSDSGSQTGPYYRAFALPTRGESGGVASGTEAYYAFDYGRAHFVALDSADSDLSPGSPMLRWLARDLEESDRDWLIAYFHHPPYSKGSHDTDDAEDSGGRLRDVRENVLPILEAAGVDLVLAGHSHNYERSYLIRGAYGFGTAPNRATPEFHALLARGLILDVGDGDPSGDGAYRVQQTTSGSGGTLYVVAGHGGAGVRFEGDHPVMYVSDVSHGSSLLEIDGDVLTLRNVRFDGEITDVVQLRKGQESGAPQVSR